MDRMGKVTMVLGITAAMVLGFNALAEEGQAAPHKGHKRGEGMNPEKMFQAWDANKDGQVSKEEFVASHEAHAKKGGKELSAEAKARAETRFAAMAGDDGMLTAEEFTASCQKMNKEHGQRGAKKCDKAAPNQNP